MRVTHQLEQPHTAWPLEEIDRNGFAIIEHLVAAKSVARLIASMHFPQDEATRTRARQPYARRNLLDLPLIRALAVSTPMLRTARLVLGDNAKPVRGILFDKTPTANWLVPWHQDLSIAVAERRDVPGFGPWSEKAGVVHVQPPCSVLRQMVTIRLHLDDCTMNNGPLRVVPGTHERTLSPNEISHRSAAGPQISCVTPAGGAVVMRPLILHASSPANAPSHRRVIHIEYAACDLPGGLRWHATSLAPA